MVACPVTRDQEPSVCQANVPLSGWWPLGLPWASRLDSLYSSGTPPRVVLVHHMHLHRAKAPAKSHLHGFGQVLRLKQQNLVL